MYINLGLPNYIEFGEWANSRQANQSYLYRAKIILGNFKAMKGVLSLSLFNNVSYHCLLCEVSSKSFINNSYLRHNV